MKGLSNEVPIFIHTYDPQKEDALRRMVDSLAGRLRTRGIELAVVDLFDLVLEHMEEKGWLNRLIEKEPDMGKEKVLGALKDLSDPKSVVVPRLVERMSQDGVKLTLLTGAGRVFPFLRTHTFLESLQPAMLQHPVVMFFPGHYTQEEGIGSQLRLFGSMPSPLLYRPYYRAFNLDHYRL
jgi:hypothetical protein